ncbi:hypothetical protein Q5P01_000487 [Channa striata]|uniref:Uncharacterized protein n=1 Tax=Channa striata TaxID=64152 RepID=A0AA88IVH7_CHASR|nr:hypothetical protein Q5P01_000487 [Channa striata]
MTRGNISLKLIKVNETDAGNYTCFVRKLHDKVKNSSVTLIVDPVGKSGEIRKSYDPTTGPETEDINSHRVYIGLGLGVIMVVVAVWLLKKYRKHSEGETSGQNKRGRADDREMSDREGTPLTETGPTDNMDDTDR